MFALPYDIRPNFSRPFTHDRNHKALLQPHLHRRSLHTCPPLPVTVLWPSARYAFLHNATPQKPPLSAPISTALARLHFSVARSPRSLSPPSRRFLLLISHMHPPFCFAFTRFLFFALLRSAGARTTLPAFTLAPSPPPTGKSLILLTRHKSLSNHVNMQLYFVLHLIALFYSPQTRMSLHAIASPHPYSSLVFSHSLTCKHVPRPAAR